MAFLASTVVAVESGAFYPRLAKTSTPILKNVCVGRTMPNGHARVLAQHVLAGSTPVVRSQFLMSEFIETSYSPSKLFGRLVRNVSVRSIEFHRDTLR